MLKPNIVHFGIAVIALVAAWPAAAAQSTFKTHVEHARAALLKEDLKKAGRELRAAGDHLEKAGASAPGTGKRDEGPRR